MFEADVHELETPLGTYTFDRNAAAEPRAYVTDPTSSVDSEGDVVGYPNQERARVGDQFGRSRVINLSGVLEAGSRETYMPERQRLTGYVNRLMRADGVLRWTPYGMAPVQMIVRRGEEPKISARATVGGMLISLRAPDPNVYSQALETVTVEAPSTSGGVRAPLRAPLVEAQSSPASVITNDGDADTFPIVRIFGPITGPRITNTTTGKTVSLPGLTIAQGDHVEINMAAPPTVRLNGAAEATRYDKVDPGASNFWPLEPGANAVELYGTNYTPGITIATVEFRHAWMP